MKQLVIALAAAVFALPVAAQRPAPEQKQDEKAPQQSQPQQSETQQERVRAEGAAGGTKPLAPEKRKAVNSGAGPHTRFNAPSPQKLPRDEPVEPGK